MADSTNMTAPGSIFPGMPAAQFPPLPYIPHFPPRPPLTEEEMVAEQMRIGAEFWSSCPAKTAMSAAGGFVLGGMFSLLMGSMAYDVPVGMGGAPVSELPFREQMKIQFKDLGTRTWSGAKNFGKIGGIFAGYECLVESLRARNDLYNGVVAGCLTGGTMAIKSGPGAAVSGCAAFAAFSFAVELYMRKDNCPPPTTDED
ncbi:Tim17/Tim22/Tim23/Pmp24 family-domain-containing protein [Limtongia smithiae]|uniref:Tim17/Tim22/Tim23/Pmp24 family-domain-containing protein n=1 Tax=Limtongia smithiae TaxID=1125753 RepID=UPI0034CED039